MHVVTGHEAFGARLERIDLGAPDPSLSGQLASLLDHHGVLIVPAQRLSAVQWLAIARAFGDVERDHAAPSTTNDGVFAADASFRAIPPAVIACHAPDDFAGEAVLSIGSTTLAWQSLSVGLQASIDALEALHSEQARSARAHDLAAGLAVARPLPGTFHPVVVRNRRTGNAALFVNPRYTSHFRDMTRGDSEPLLSLLHAASLRADRFVRHRFVAGDVVLRDNRATIACASGEAEAWARIVRVQLDAA